MSEFLSTNLPYLLFGISVGGQYALIAIGYTMVYGILRLINFAHGDVFMVAGLIMVYATASLPIYVSIIIVVVATILLGVIIEKVAYKPLRSAPRMSVMISAIGVSYLLQNCALYFTGGLPQIYPNISFLSKQIQIGAASTKMVTIITPIITIVLVILLVVLIKKTKIGMAMRAVSKDFETSELMGIKINNVISMTFVIGCGLAAVGSLLYFTNYTSVIPTSGSMPGLKAFVAAVFGGIGSISGSCIGAFLYIACSEWWLRFLDSGSFMGMSVPFFRDGFRKVVFSVVIMVIVLFFSRGIMGDKEISFTGMIRKLRKRKGVPAVADEGKEGEQR